MAGLTRQAVDLLDATSLPTHTQHATSYCLHAWDMCRSLAGRRAACAPPLHLPMFCSLRASIELIIIIIKPPNDTLTPSSQLLTSTEASPSHVDLGVRHCFFRLSPSYGLPWLPLRPILLDVTLYVPISTAGIHRGRKRQAFYTGLIPGMTFALALPPFYPTPQLTRFPSSHIHITADRKCTQALCVLLIELPSNMGLLWPKGFDDGARGRERGRKE
jgi:hypothetical protein